MMHYHAVRLGTDDRIMATDTNGYYDELDAQDHAREMLTNGVKQTGWIECEDSTCSVNAPKPVSTKVKAAVEHETVQRQGTRKARVTICAKQGCKTGFSGNVKIDSYAIPLCEKDMREYKAGKTLAVRFWHKNQKLEAEINKDD